MKENNTNDRGFKPLSLIGLLYATNHLFAEIYVEKGDKTYALMAWLGFVYDNHFSTTEICYDEFLELMHPFLDVFLTQSELESL